MKRLRGKNVITKDLTPSRPKNIVAKVNATATKAVLSADMQERMLPLGVEPAPSTAAQFVARLQAETNKWAKLMKDANIRPTE